MTAEITRRSALKLMGAGAGAAAIAACAPASAPAGPAETGGTKTPIAGGTLRYGAVQDVNRLDPHFRVGNVYIGVYDRLTEYDINYKPQPMLAESWDIATDWKQIKFNLRKGVQFHSGKELTAEDVKKNSERARDLKNTQLDEAKWWSSIETPDKYTVIFKSTVSRPLAFDFFEYLNIADPAVYDNPTKAIGTGPFRFIEWKQGSQLRLEKNKSWWQSGKPYIDSIVMSVINDPQALTARLEADALDITEPSASDFVRLRGNPKYQTILQNYSGGAFTPGPHCLTPPWNNKKARQALLYAVDRNRWANTVNKGLVTPSALPWSKSSPAYDEKKGNAYPFDPEKARSLLKEAGVTGTFNQDMMVQAGNAESADYAQIFQADMAKLGVNLNIKPLEGAAYLDTINNWRYQGFWVGGSAFAHLDPATALTKSRGLSPGGNSSAFTAPANKYALELIARGTSETDPAKRKQIYSDINDMLLDEVYVTIMSPTNTRTVASSKLKGFTPTLHGGYRWWDVWFDK